jgi:hypothetical protein
VATKIASACVAISGIVLLPILIAFPSVFSHPSESTLFVLLVGIYVAGFQAILVGITFVHTRDENAAENRNLRIFSTGFLVATLSMMLATYVYETTR